MQNTENRARAFFLLTFLVALTSFVALARPGQAVEIIAPSGEALQMEVNKGQLLRLPADASSVFVANPEIADIQVRSPRLIYVLGKAYGETTVIALDRSEQVLANISVEVIHNVARLQNAVARMHPSSGIQVSSVGGAIVLEGEVASASTAEDLRSLAARFAGSGDQVVNRLGVAAPSQVNLRVRVAEVSRDLDKQLGFNWDLAGTLGGFALGLANTNPFSAAVTQQTLSLGFDSSSITGNSIIDALEQEGLITVLAEPNLTALSGETASFLAGGEFPILVPGSSGEVTIQFKKFGVSLAFTPTIINDRINLHVRPEVSQLSSTNSVTLNNFTVPSLTTRRAETTVELGSGQSFAIGGLIQNNTTHDVSKFPGLGDIPVLGQLFRSDRFQRDESELVIIVTPFLVKPISKGPLAQARMAAPTDGYTPPSDVDRFVTGGTYRRNPVRPEKIVMAADERRLAGPVGFQLD
ncbi:MAG: type II and III secretion system protein family protein [Magnetovibrionaceae bacterium]